MKKIIPALVFTALLAFLVAPAVGLAIGTVPGFTILEKCSQTHDLTGKKGYTGDCGPAKNPQNDPLCCTLDLVSSIGDWIFAGVLILAGIMVLLGAYNFITAGGSPEKVNKARDYLLYALVGVAVAFLSKGFVAFVQSVVGGSPQV